MYKNILVATDGSRLSGKAVTHAIALARALGATLTGFYASPDYPLPVYAEGAIVEPMSRREYAAMCKNEADRILGAVAAKAKSRGLRSTPCTRSRRRRGTRFWPRRTSTNATRS